MPTREKTLRTILLDPAVDHFLSVRAADMSMDKRDLIQKYLIAGARQDLLNTMEAPLHSSPGNFISTGSLRLARVAKIIPMSKDPDSRDLPGGKAYPEVGPEKGQGVSAGRRVAKISARQKSSH